jgi:hypothetical protein
MALIQCKECGEEISKKAEQCPKCGAPRKKKIGFFKGLLILFVVLFFIGLFVPESQNTIRTPSNTAPSNTNNSSNSKTNPSNTTAKVEKVAIALPKVGDTITTKKFEIKINLVTTTSYVGNEYFNAIPPEGATFVGVDWQYKNISSKPLGSFSLPTLNLVAPDGTKYKIDTEATAALKTGMNLSTYVLSDLNPGISTKDVSVFEVAKSLYDPKTWQLYINADNDQEVIIK